MNTLSTRIFLLVACILCLNKVNAQNLSLLFDGSNDRVTIPHHASYDWGTGNFTIEALVNIPTTTTSTVPIFSSRTSGTQGILLYCSHNMLLIQMNGVPNYLSSSFTPINDGQCHHIAVTRIGTELYFYVDGTLAGGVICARSMTAPGAINVGFDAVDGSKYKGSISELRFWNITRTQTELSAYRNATIPNATTGLVGLWRFNEASGQTVTDESVTANHGVLGTNNTVETSDPTRDALCDNGTVLSIFSPVENAALFSIAPNPFSNETILSFEDKLSSQNLLVDIEVLTAQGVSLLKKPVSAADQISLGNEFPKGIYLLKVTANSQTQTLRIVKE